MIKLKITVDKDILERSKNCSDNAQNNCAIALAVRDIFPKACIGRDRMWFDTHPGSSTGKGVFVVLPREVEYFIDLFDSRLPIERTDLPELTFEIEIPDEVVGNINIDEIRPSLGNHPTLELIENG